MGLIKKQKLRAIYAASALLCAAPASAESFLGVYGGYQFGAQGANLRAQEDLNYTGNFKNLHPATGSDLSLENSPTFGIRAGHYFDAIPGLGIEADVQYSTPNFKQQNVTIGLTDGTTIGGTNSFTENQLPANFRMFTGGVNVLYRYNGLQSFKPYVGAGPALLGLSINGTGDSCNIVAPANLARGFCSGGNMTSGGLGIGFNAKAGVEIPISEHLSLDAEYKYTYGSVNVLWFRSFSDIHVDYSAHNVVLGLRYQF